MNPSEHIVHLLVAFLWGGIVASAGLGVARTAGRELVRYGSSQHARALIQFVFVWLAAAVLIWLDYRTKGGS